VRLLNTLSFAGLFLAAAFAGVVELGWLAEARTPELGSLPTKLGPLEFGAEIPFDAAALGQTPPEAYTFRAVTDAAGREGRLFIAYYARAQRWSGRPHDVDKCFAAMGYEEREVHVLDEAHRPWSRRFEKEGIALRVVHWLERPGDDANELGLAPLVARLADGSGFRPDVCSVYFEFPAEGAPDDVAAAEAVAALSSALDARW
jgi:hypothetical protein